jgi:hypothetical protein
MVTLEIPRPAFLQAVNSDLSRPRGERTFDVRFRHPAESKVSELSVCRIFTRPRVQPAFYLQLNFSMFPGDLCRQIVELNPNKLRGGFRELMETIVWIFGSIPGDMKISRLDSCADIELPVDFFLHSLRIPYKRKSVHYLGADGQVMRTYSDRGVTGFTIGASPAMLRVYDKREELRRMREDVSSLPPILTRFEWELRHRKCPVRRIFEIDRLLEYRPFDAIEILSTNEVYDFHNDTRRSTKRFLFDQLARRYGRHEAIRILNFHRNFRRDYDGIVEDNQAIKDRLNRSFRAGVQLFFENRGADIRYRYGGGQAR